MDRGQLAGQWVGSFEEMTQQGPAVTRRTTMAVAGFINRSAIGGEHLVFEVYFFIAANPDCAVAAVAGRQYAIEHIDTVFDGEF